MPYNVFCALAWMTLLLASGCTASAVPTGSPSGPATITPPPQAIVASSTPVSAGPTVVTPPSIAKATERADLLAPTPEPGNFWANDEPKALSPLAFGILQSDYQPGPGVAVGGLELSTPFPSFPRELEVYLVGDYPADHCNILLNIVKTLQDWDCIPFYSLVQYRGDTPLGEKSESVSRQQVEERAIQLIKERGLLMRDQSTPTARQNDDGTWRVWFFQRIAGIAVYANKGLAVTINRDGQATNIIGRRRPLLAHTRYPLRTPEEAWQRLKEGHAHSFYVDDLSSPRPCTEYRFTQVELAYAEVEVLTAQQIMQPYYIFRSETGQSLYTPAVADPFIR